MIKKFIVIIALVLTSSFASADIFTTDTSSTVFGLAFVTRGTRGWDDRLNLTIASIDKITSILSNDAGSAVLSVTEGVAGPLVIQPITGDVIISIISADISTDGTIDATQYRKINIISNDVAILFSTQTIISNDIADLKIEVTILSNDVQAISGTVVILSSDVNINTANIATNVTSINILSNDVNAISGTVVIISNDMGEAGLDTDQPKIQFGITAPNDLATNQRGDQMVPVWVNDSGKTFTVTKIQAFSDKPHYSFHLGITTSLTDFSIANQTTMDVISCDEVGTNISIDTITSGFDDATVATGQYVLFQHFEASADIISVNIYGAFQ